MRIKDFMQLVGASSDCAVVFVDGVEVNFGRYGAIPKGLESLGDMFADNIKAVFRGVRCRAVEYTNADQDTRSLNAFLDTALGPVRVDIAATDHKGHEEFLSRSFAKGRGHKLQESLPASILASEVAEIRSTENDGRGLVVRVKVPMLICHDADGDIYVLEEDAMPAETNGYMFEARCFNPFETPDENGCIENFTALWNPPAPKDALNECAETGGLEDACDYLKHPDVVMHRGVIKRNAAIMAAASI